jgi:hypothetical protein
MEVKTHNSTIFSWLKSDQQAPFYGARKDFPDYELQQTAGLGSKKIKTTNEMVLFIFLTSCLLRCG